jgi:calcineurin-like phosphoesterase
MGWFLDGRVSAVVGTHTHVQTADERILPNGTAYITDLGMTGPYKSILGRDIDRVLKAIITQMPTRFEVAEKDVRMSGAVITLDSSTGKAIEIKRLVVHEKK